MLRAANRRQRRLKQTRVCVRAAADVQPARVPLDMLFAMALLMLPRYYAFIAFRDMMTPPLFAAFLRDALQRRAYEFSFLLAF